MDASRGRSKKPSASSATPPEAVVFFLDRCLGKAMAGRLRQAGARVEVHDDHFASDAPDAVWLTEVGQRGWVVLTKDQRIRRRTLERDALTDAGVRAFVLTSGNLTGEEMARIFIQNMRKMMRLLRGEPGPFMANVTWSGVAVIYAARRAVHARQR